MSHNILMLGILTKMILDMKPNSHLFFFANNILYTGDQKGKEKRSHSCLFKLRCLKMNNFRGQCLDKTKFLMC